MANPNAYEVIDPSDFGIERQIQFAHRLTGWNAIFGRSKQLGLDLTDDQVRLSDQDSSVPHSSLGQGCHFSNQEPC